MLNERLWFAVSERVWVSNPLFENFLITRSNFGSDNGYMHSFNDLQRTLLKTNFIPNY